MRPRTIVRHRRLALWGAAWVFCALIAEPATRAQQTRWRRLGGVGIAAGFAGPAGSPVAQAWFSDDGRRLYVALENGALWLSEDAGFSWTFPGPMPNQAPSSGQETILERGAQPAVLVRNSYRANVVYALGEHLYRSDDDGTAWTNLTAVGSASVIGPWQATLAVSPVSPDLIVVGNSRGLWKSYDAGVTWSSLNDTLPNFPAARFRPARGAAPPQLEAQGFGTLELIRTADGSLWRVAAEAWAAWSQIPAPEQTRVARPRPLAPPGYAASYRIWRDGQPISGDLTGCQLDRECHDAANHAVTALADNGYLWAGTSNGRIWVSRDEGNSWLESWTDPDAAPVASLWAHPERPSTALAVAAGRILRSTNGGVSWFDITSDLPESHWTAVAGHPQAGAVYVGGPRGVYFSQVDLALPGPAAAWTELSGNLPSRDVRDVALDSLRGRLYASLPGHGIYWMRAPQVEHALRALSAADLSARPAAPGSLLTVLGADAVRARADGQLAPILGAGHGQTQLQLPFELSGRTLRLQLDESNARHAINMALEDVSPAIFVVGGEPLILDAGTGAWIGWNQPARPGGNILVMATGLGKVDPPWPAGVPSPERDPPRPIATISALLDSLPARVVSAQLASGYIGIYVVEVEVPLGATTGRGQLSLLAAGRTSNQVGLVVGQ